MDKRKMFEYFFGCPPETFGETAIITPFLPAKKFSEHCRSLATFKGRLYSGIRVSKYDREFCVIHCGMGDRFMGDAVLLLGITPVKKIFFAGACGGLKDCGIGDLLVCENAFNGEGFTRYYTQLLDMEKIFDAGELIPSDPEYTGSLKRFLPGALSDEVSMRSGDIFTIGSILAEREKNLLGIEQKGFKGIDMELSAVYHAARVTDQKITGMVVVSDLPMKRPMWEDLAPEEKKSYDKGFSELVRLAVEFTAKV